jgi:hypothetical protein
MTTSTKAERKAAFQRLARTASQFTATSFLAGYPSQAPSALSLTIAQGLLGGLPGATGCQQERMARLASKLDRLRELDQASTQKRRASGG